MPPSSESSPLVVAPSPEPAPEAGSTAVAASDDSLSPMTEMALPPTVTGDRGVDDGLGAAEDPVLAGGARGAALGCPDRLGGFGGGVRRLAVADDR